ncbi:transposase [Microlunatus sp. Gsoil 973]|uniref:transposase n=1 Tax=Microlunatus sp. Gsoil 973 TaxID=2672569 RepID=UPI0018A84C6F
MQLREVFAAKGTWGRWLLAGWLSWARRSRLPAFVKLAKTIERYRRTMRTTARMQRRMRCRQTSIGPPTETSGDPDNLTICPSIDPVVDQLESFEASPVHDAREAALRP